MRLRGVLEDSARASWRYYTLRVFLTVAILVGIGFGVHRATRVGHGGPPKLMVNTWKADLGLLTPGRSASYDFTIRNQGAGELVIHDVRTSCGCTPATLSRKRLAKGTTSTLSVKVTAPMYSGAVSHAVYLKTNDPDHLEVMLPVVAKSEWSIEASPSRFTFSRLRIGEEFVAEVRLTSARQTSHFEIKAIKPTSPSIKVEEIEKSARETKYRLHFRGKHPGPINELVTFQTTSEDRPEIIIPIVGHVDDRTTVSPARVMLGPVNPRGSRDFSLVVDGESQASQELKTVLDTSDWKVLSSEIHPLKGDRWEIRVSIRVPDSAGYKRTRLELRSPQGSIIGATQVSCLVQPG